MKQKANGLSRHFMVLGEIIEVDKAFLKPVPEVPHLSNREERKGIAGKSFAMVIDLSRCKNLKKCHGHPIFSNFLKQMQQTVSKKSRID